MRACCQVQLKLRICKGPKKANQDKARLSRVPCHALGALAGVLWCPSVGECVRTGVCVCGVIRFRAACPAPEPQCARAATAVRLSSEMCTPTP
jgi:hypothetical protein